MADPNISDNWITTSILAIVTTLASTVAFLYKKISDYSRVREMELKEELRLFKEETNKELTLLRAEGEKCRQDHMAALLRSAKLEQRIDDLERKSPELSLIPQHRGGQKH